MQDPRDITKGILEKNRVRLNAMVDLIGRKETIAFVGAGLSQPLGFPVWNKLLKELRNEARTIDKNNEFRPTVRLTNKTALKYADELQSFFRAHDQKLTLYREFLGNTFKRPATGEAFTDVQRTVVSLPFKTWVTTNFDVCLEDAFGCSADTVVVQQDGGNAHTVSDCLLSLHESKRPSVIHIHGVHSQTEQIILSATDYAKA